MSDVLTLSTSDDDATFSRKVKLTLHAEASREFAVEAGFTAEQAVEMLRPDIMRQLSPLIEDELRPVRQARDRALARAHEAENLVRTLQAALDNITRANR